MHLYAFLCNDSNLSVLPSRRPTSVRAGRTACESPGLCLFQRKNSDEAVVIVKMKGRKQRGYPSVVGGCTSPSSVLHRLVL